MQCQMLMIQQGKSIQQVEKEGLRPAMYKNVQPPMHDPNFRSICANTETRVLLAHIRASSGTAVTAVNNHPFVFGRHCKSNMLHWRTLLSYLCLSSINAGKSTNEASLRNTLTVFLAFMHNGYITDFTTIRRGMTAKMSNLAFAGVNGGTDSEHLAAVYMTHLTANATSSDPFDEVYTLKQMSEAMTYAIRVAMTLQRDMLGDKRSANSLNLCATDGEKMVSCRYRNHETSQPPSLYYSDKAGVTLNRKYPDHPDGLPIKKKAERTAREEDYGTHLIIASEPSTYIMADWKLIGKNQQLTANEKGEFALEDLVQFGPEWNAKKA